MLAMKNNNSSWKALHVLVLLPIPGWALSIAAAMGLAVVGALVWVTLLRRTVRSAGTEPRNQIPPALRAESRRSVPVAARWNDCRLESGVCPDAPVHFRRKWWDVPIGSSTCGSERQEQLRRALEGGGAEQLERAFRRKTARW